MVVQMIQEDVLLTFKEAMSYLRVSRSTLYRLMWSGQLTGHKVGFLPALGNSVFFISPFYVFF